MAAEQAAHGHGQAQGYLRVAGGADDGRFDADRGCWVDVGREPLGQLEDLSVRRGCLHLVDENGERGGVDNGEPPGSDVDPVHLAAHLVR